MNHKMLFVGSLVLALPALASGLTRMSCKVEYELNHETYSFEIQGVPQAKGYFLINEDLDLPGSRPNLYVYYSGSYASVNLQDRDHQGYYGADAEVPLGKNFTLTVNTNELDPQISYLNILCQGH